MAWLEKYWRFILALWIALFFIQSLFFKFSGAPEAEYIFGVVGDQLAMPWFATYGAYLFAVLEFGAAVLLFTRLRPWGALASAALMTCGVMFHLFTPLGVVLPTFNASGNIVGDDSGRVFIMACLTWNAAAVLVVDDWLSLDSSLRSPLAKAT